MAAILSRGRWVVTLRPRWDEKHFPGDIFKYILLNENMWISINISLKSVPKNQINNIPAPCRRQAIIWINDGKFTDA